MNLVFADTAFYIAMANPRDALHARAMEFAANYRGRYLTTEFVLMEFGNFFSKPDGRRVFVQALSSLRNDPFTEIVPVSTDLFEVSSSSKIGLTRPGH